MWEFQSLCFLLDIWCCQFFKFCHYDGHVVIAHCGLKFNMLYNFTNVFYFSFPLICKPLKGSISYIFGPCSLLAPRQNIAHGTCLVNTCWVGTSPLSTHCVISPRHVYLRGGLPPTPGAEPESGLSTDAGHSGLREDWWANSVSSGQCLFCAVVSFLPGTHGPEERQSWPWLSREGGTTPGLVGHQLRYDPAGSFSEPLFVPLLNSRQIWV